MHEVAEPAAIAFTVLILAAACFSEVGYRRKLRIQRSTYVKSMITAEKKIKKGSYLHTIFHYSYPQQLGPPFPIRTGHKRCQ